MTSVAVFTLTMDRIEYTRRTFESLGKSTGMRFDHFVVDNGSTDGTKQFLEANRSRFKGLIINERNTGLANGWNQALDMIGDRYDYIVKVDNDCEFVQHGWLEVLVDVCEACDRRIVLSPRVEGLAAPPFDGGHPRDEWAECEGHVLGLTKHLGGICHFAPREAYRGFRFGKVPDHGNQDVRFSIHARLDLGLPMAYVEDVRVRHMDGSEGQRLRYPDYHEGRAELRRRVYGEPALVTALLRPPRRLALLLRMDRAGLIPQGLRTYAAQRVAARISRKPGPSQWLPTGDVPPVETLRPFRDLRTADADRALEAHGGGR